jgi:hypothetical protein
MTPALARAPAVGNPAAFHLAAVAIWNRRHGPAAFQWIDRLRDAGQAWWQVLPLGATGYGNSPYQPLSSFAGNWLLISPGCAGGRWAALRADCEGRFPGGCCRLRMRSPHSNGA